MTTHDQLDESLLFEAADDTGERHLSEVAVTAIADGQNVVSAAALAHFESCDRCSMQVAEAALLACAMHEVVRDAFLAHAAKATAEPVRALDFTRRRTAVRAVALAVSVAVAAAMPMAYVAWTHVAGILAGTMDLFSFIGQLTVAVGRRNSELAQVRLVFSYGLASMMLIAGFTVARTQSRTAWK